MERYSEAQKELDKIINAEDVEYLSDALFYNFIACLALDDYSKASENLLKLVYEFPEDERMPDIYEQLANVYFLQEQYLFSWYWYEKLYAISLHAEQLLILDKIEAIKNKIAATKNLKNQFINFIPKYQIQFELKVDTTDSLRVKVISDSLQIEKIQK